MLGEKIIDLKRELIDYATMAENMIEESMQGLVNKDKKILNEIIQKKEPEANQREIQLEELCTHLIAQYEPRAKDLRTILMIYKMVNDIERLADHAVNIAESALILLEQPLVKPLNDLPKMTAAVLAMLKESIDSFIREDADTARQVCRQDTAVDDFRKKINDELISVMKSDSKVVERALHLLRIAGNLERIADLSTNISEDTIFMVAGKVIKHHTDKSV